MSCTCDFFKGISTVNYVDSLLSNNPLYPDVTKMLNSPNFLDWIELLGILESLIRIYWRFDYEHEDSRSRSYG